MQHSKRGFTLVEIMVVISVIAILASILIMNFLHARAEAQTAGCEANLKMLATAVEEYAVDNGSRYPSSIASLTSPYLSVQPHDPASGLSYTLSSSPPAGASYEIDDAGGHDTTTTSSLPSGPGTGSLMYAQNAGIRAK